MFAVQCIGEGWNVTQGKFSTRQKATDYINEAYYVSRWVDFDGGVWHCYDHNAHQTFTAYIVPWNHNLHEN